ncbi:MAG: alpha-amylase family glycosyl hydrolase [Pseudoflavonifractor sp.]
MWADEALLYQIYPLGFCGAPRENDGVLVPRIRKLEGWISHLQRLGVDGLVLNPVFQSDRHGYDTRDFRVLDCRLGSNEDFRAVSAALHGAGIRLLLDGVFNHVGRGFWAFQDLLKNREASPYRDWFHVEFGGSNGYGDGLWYEGWEGHFELVKLNLQNPQVVDYLLDCVKFWAEEFGVDGLRLDVAYCLPQDFLRRLAGFCRGLSPDFFLYGEILGGDYRRIVAPDLLPSCTNYECFKGLWSSCNDMNLFEINSSLNRMFSADPYALYRGLQLVSFADNHDVSRLASNLKNPAHLPLVYGLLLTMPGIPLLYYGSEWGILGDKRDGDDALRPCCDAPLWNDLTDRVAALIAARKKSRALQRGGYQTVAITNRQLVFLREDGDQKVLVAVNLDQAPATVNLGGYALPAKDLMTGKAVALKAQQPLPGYAVEVWGVN